LRRDIDGRDLHPERIRARQRQRVFRKAFLIDPGYCFLGSFLPKLILIVPTALVGDALHRPIPGAFYARVAAVWASGSYP
jgi:hypothetical protein